MIKKLKFGVFLVKIHSLILTLKTAPCFAIFYDENSVLIGDENGTIFHKDFFYSEKDSIFYKNPLPIYDASLNKTNNKLVITR